MAKRYEFSKSVRREALRRAGGVCEAMGAVYGLEPGERCTTSLDAKGLKTCDLSQWKHNNGFLTPCLLTPMIA